MNKIHVFKKLKHKEIGNKKGLTASLSNIGLIYSSQGDISKALEYQYKSLKIRKDIGEEKGIAYSLINIGFLYKNQGNNSQALKYYHQSLKILEGINDNYGISNSLFNIGGIYKNKGDITRALDYYHRSLKIQKKIGDKKGISNTLTYIGEIMLDKGNVQEAKNDAQRSLAIAQKIGFPKSIRESAKLLSQIYEKQGKGIQALEMYKLYITMKDSINNEATQKASAQQQAKYEYEKQKAIDDAENEKLIAIEKQERAKQKILTTATASGLILVVIFLAFVFNRLQVTKKQKKQIESQKSKVERQKEVVELAHHELEEKNQEILDSITYAKRIQSAILPPAKVIKEYLKNSFILYKPKDIVAGDFYWMETVSNNTSLRGTKQSVKKNKIASLHKSFVRNDVILFAAADCTGHGVPGAMVSVVCNNALNRSVREHGLSDPGEILTKTREIVIQEFEKSDEEVKDGMDIALCSLERNTLKYAGANNPLWIIRDNEIIETKAHKQPIGKVDNPLPYTTHTFELQKGDTIYIFSDGFVDQFGGEKGKKFKAKAFRELLLSIQDKSMEEQKTIIDNTFESWKGNLEQVDDVCVIGVRI